MILAAQHLVAAAGTSSAFGASDQDYLFQARQMQALSFAVHIPLVCFGDRVPGVRRLRRVAAPAHRRRLYRTLARRWSKVMLALFAVGVVTGTILSFEMGLLWPNFMATFGDVFGLGFAIEGISFFVEAIFIGDLRLRLGPPVAARAPAHRHPDHRRRASPGSLMVIAVNGWMNHPTGFVLQDGRAVDVHPFEALFDNGYFWHELVHMYLAGLHRRGLPHRGRLRVGAAARPLRRATTAPR